jgi:hypothetical protein
VLDAGDGADGAGARCKSRVEGGAARTRGGGGPQPGQEDQAGGREGQGAPHEAPAAGDEAGHRLPRAGGAAGLAVAPAARRPGHLGGRLMNEAEPLPLGSTSYIQCCPSMHG